MDDSDVPLEWKEFAASERASLGKSRDKWHVRFKLKFEKDKYGSCAENGSKDIYVVCAICAKAGVQTNVHKTGGGKRTPHCTVSAMAMCCSRFCFCVLHVLFFSLGFNSKRARGGLTAAAATDHTIPTGRGRCWCSSSRSFPRSSLCSFPARRPHLLAPAVCSSCSSRPWDKTTRSPSSLREAIIRVPPPARVVHLVGAVIGRVATF